MLFFFQDEAQKFSHGDLFPDVVTYTTLLKVRYFCFINFLMEFKDMFKVFAFLLPQ